MVERKRQAVETRGRTSYNTHNQQKIHSFNQPQTLKIDSISGICYLKKKSRQSLCLHENMKPKREERVNRQK